MTDQSLIALRRLMDQYARSQITWGVLCTCIEEAFAAALAREQEAQPALSKAKWSDPPEIILRAMARNYVNGHQWDTLDSLACTRAAHEIEQLRAAQPAAQEPSK